MKDHLRDAYVKCTRVDVTLVNIIQRSKPLDLKIQPPAISPFKWITTHDWPCPFLKYRPSRPIYQSTPHCLPRNVKAPAAVKAKAKVQPKQKADPAESREKKAKRETKDEVEEPEKEKPKRRKSKKD